MVNLSETSLFLIQFLFSETTIERHLISENALQLQFIPQKKCQKYLYETRGSDEILPLAISALKCYLIENINIKDTIITDTIPSYDSLLIHFNLEQIRGLQFKYLIEKNIQTITTFIEKNEYKKNIYTDKNTSKNTKAIKIPVYYGIDVGWDLQTLSAKKELSVDTFVSIHCEKIYTVCAIGFSPGFAYMGFVSPKIQHKRLSNPRTKVFPGSIGIAENQTGIYPNASPGGWNIIGRTPTKTIDLDNVEKPSLFSIGDKVKFDPIDKKTYLSLGGKIDTP